LFVNLFNDAIIISTVVLNGTVIIEWWIGNVVENTWHDIMYCCAIYMKRWKKQQKTSAYLSWLRLSLVFS